MAIRLTIEPTDDPDNVIAHDLDQSLVTVGRSKSCHIELDHPEISRRHFFIRYEEAGYVLLDEDSRHGTKLDGLALTPDSAYPLGSDHVIEVPGFRILLNCDGERPRLERTTVVARQLLDDLLQGEIRPREVPSLRSTDGRYQFKFVEEKTTFVLGSLAHADFVVTDDKIAKKHVSFIRDIFGVRVVPNPGHDVAIDAMLISEPQVLRAGSTITVGAIDLVFNEASSMKESTIIEIPQPAPTIAERPREENPKDEPAQEVVKKGTALNALDGVFVLGFVAVIVGAVVIVANL